MKVPVAPNRELGQHFLVDDNILGVIGRLAELGAGDVVLEVGPGLGVLTEYLAERVATVHAVELDRGLEPHLAERLRGRQNVALTFGDALRLDLAALDPAPTKFVANLPYRLFARPGTKAYGAVSVLVQLAAERTGFHPVSRTVFRPPPNVDSALVAFHRVPLPEDFPAVKSVVEAAFAHRRKTLPNSIELAGRAQRARGAEALAAIDRDPAARAEALEPHEFVALTAALR